jgi:hypothetical protein
MVFAVVGIGFKSDRLFVERNTDSHRYIQNLDHLGFVDVMNGKYGPFD